MGFWSSFFNFFNPKTKKKIIFVGLDNSGKTTIINNLRGEVDLETAPTIGYNVETLNMGNFDFTIFDMSGMDSHRDLWETHYYQVDAIVFVIDGADEMRYQVAAYEFEQLLENKDIKGRNIPILIFLNKMDLKGCCSYQDCVDFLELNNVKNKSWNIEPSNALKGIGLREGMTWLMEKLKEP